MKREILVEIILGVVVILLIVAIREIRMVRSSLQHSYATQPYPTVQVILQTPTPLINQAYPTSQVISPPNSAGCTKDKDCGGSWCTDAEPPSCYEEKCINGTCATVQTSWHNPLQMRQ